MGALVHLGVLGTLLSGTTSGVENVFCVDNILRWETESSFALLGGLWPFVLTGVADTEGLTLVGLIVSFHGVVELVGEAVEVLCLNHSVNVVTHILGTSVGVILKDGLLILTHTWVHLDLTRLHVREFAVLADVWWGASVACALEGELVGADAIV